MAKRSSEKLLKLFKSNEVVVFKDHAYPVNSGNLYM